MTVLLVPNDGRTRWPTLGPLVCDWIEENLCFGPGPLLGEPAVIDNETRALIYRVYELFPRGHEDEGHRRFLRACLSFRKGLAKTEKAAWIGAAELHPEAPVRFAEWRRQGSAWVPDGQSVTDPYIPFLAYTEEQTDRLAFGALKQILKRCPAGEALEVWEDRIIRADGSGYAEAVAASPSARDGERTTFQHFDETHRMYAQRLRETVEVMEANPPKLGGWSLSTTTAYEPGQGSVAEDQMREAQEVAKGERNSPRFFFFHRGASDGHDLKTEDGVRAAIIEATGPEALKWTRVSDVIDRWRTTKDPAYFERVWLNRPVASSRQAFDVPALTRGQPVDGLPAGALVTLGFDGARRRDSSGLVATDVVTGRRSVLGYWPRPADAPIDWRVSEGDIDLAMEYAFTTFDVWRLYADPHKFESALERWAGRYGRDRVAEFDTRHIKRMCFAVYGYTEAISAGETSHGGHRDPGWEQAFVDHHANARKHMRDVWLEAEQRTRLFTIEKQHPESTDWIDLAMAACLSWEARGHAIAAGAEASNQGAILTIY